MDDTGRVNQAMMQWLTDCLTPWKIDRAVGEMREDSANGPQLATYARYNALLDQEWLATEVKAKYGANQLKEIAEMDNPSNMDQLSEIGRLTAAIQVKAEHFSKTFDTP
jgi:hypothetical protein